MNNLKEKYYVDIEKIIEDDKNIDLIKVSFKESEDLVKGLLNDLDDSFNGVVVDKEAFVFKHEKKYIMIINTDKFNTNTRYRFSLAHELGHIRLGHLEKLKVIYRDIDSSLGYNRLEVEANKYAAERLMPEESIKEMLELGCKFGDIKVALEVSISALTNRLENLGYTVTDHE